MTLFFSSQCKNDVYVATEFHIVAQVMVWNRS